MKQLLTIVFIGLSTVSFAKEIKVHTTDDSFESIYAKFNVNPSLGRAWVELEITEDSWEADEEEYVEEVRVKVPGLAYNQNNNSVEYTDDYGTTICMNTITRGRGIFKRTILVTTGNCTFKEKKVYREYDDGYYVSTKRYFETYLVIK